MSFQKGNLAVWFAISLAQFHTTMKKNVHLCTSPFCSSNTKKRLDTKLWENLQKNQKKITKNFRYIKWKKSWTIYYIRLKFCGLVFFPYKPSLEIPGTLSSDTRYPKNHSEVSPTLWDFWNGLWNRKTHGIKGQLGVPLTVYPWYLLCSVGVVGDYSP